ncbi:MAG TPA: hypothetical protein DEB24_01900 [Coriobacteriia bacterium]|nr:hypothetical protein [Coriobacteriia bacterium]
MALFGKKEEVVPYEVAKANLAAKDGKLHVIMVNTWNTCAEHKFNCDAKVTGELDQVLSGMQDDGYEIVGVQHTSLSTGVGFDVVGYTTLITYR